MISAQSDKEVRDRLVEAYRASRLLSKRPQMPLGGHLTSLWIWSRMDFTKIENDELVRVLYLLGNLVVDVHILHRLNRLRLCAKRGRHELPPREDLAVILGCPRDQLDRVIDSEHAVVFGEIKAAVGEVRDGDRLNWLLSTSLPDLKHVLALVSCARDSVLQELERTFHAGAEVEFGDRARTWVKAQAHVAALRARCAKGGDL